MKAPLHLTDKVGTPDLAAVAAIVDPLNYKQYFTMPLLVIDATGDEFFLPDDDYFWWHRDVFPNNKQTFRLIIPNAEHSSNYRSDEFL
jgi:PhoPQ-activated pathogenicity-related protein